MCVCGVWSGGACVCGVWSGGACVCVWCVEWGCVCVCGVWSGCVCVCGVWGVGVRVCVCIAVGVLKPRLVYVGRVLQVLMYKVWFKHLVTSWLKVALNKCKERIASAVKEDQVSHSSPSSYPFLTPWHPAVSQLQGMVTPPTRGDVYGEECMHLVTMLLCVCGVVCVLVHVLMCVLMCVCGAGVCVGCECCRQDHLLLIVGGHADLFEPNGSILEGLGLAQSRRVLRLCDNTD